jgi:hypothetical protein
MTALLTAIHQGGTVAGFSIVWKTPIDSALIVERIPPGGYVCLRYVAAMNEPEKPEDERPI